MWPRPVLSNYAGAVGDPSAVGATDDVGVVRVEVSLADGAVRESGDAALDGWRWVYTAQTAVPAGTTVRVTARAFDRPGEGEAEVRLPA